VRGCPLCQNREVREVSRKRGWGCLQDRTPDLILNRKSVIQVTEDHKEDTEIHESRRAQGNKHFGAAGTQSSRSVGKENTGGKGTRSCGQSRSHAKELGLYFLGQGL
jgi:hypothetical protein